MDSKAKEEGKLGDPCVFDLDARECEDRSVLNGVFESIQLT